MSEQSSSIKHHFPPRGLLIHPFVVFAFVSLTVGFVANKIKMSSSKTPFFHLFFSDVLHKKAWLISASLVLELCQLLTASRICIVAFPATRPLL